MTSLTPTKGRTFTPYTDPENRLRAGYIRVYLAPGEVYWIHRDEVRATGKSATQIARTR
jgi:hypothetical protein